MSPIPESQYIRYRKMVEATKDGGAPTAQTTRKSITGKFSAALDSAQGNETTDPLKDKKDKVLKSEGLISANISDPSKTQNLMKKPEDD